MAQVQDTVNILTQGKMRHWPSLRSSTTQRQFPQRPPQYMPISVIASVCARLKYTAVKLCIPAAPLNSSGVGGACIILFAGGMYPITWLTKRFRAASSNNRTGSFK